MVWGWAHTRDLFFYLAKKEGSQYIIIIIIIIMVIGEFHMHPVGFKRMTLPFIPLLWEEDMSIQL